MPVETISWKVNSCHIIDQTRLPEKLRYKKIQTIEEMWTAIRELQVRGAPAIGIAAAYGLYLGIRDSQAREFASFEKDIEKASKYLGSSRPTAVNLFWALERMKDLARKHREIPVRMIKQKLLEEAHLILAEDIRSSIALGDAGAELLPDGARILTHCNAGGLATGGYGTALAVIYRAVESGKKISVFADETRPLLQGARLTCWELAMNNIPVTAICDNMAAWVMARGMVDAVLVGADRIAANGDFANKIGTYGLATLAKAHRIPFYAAAPLSTFDISLENGDLIPIEERDASEVMRLNGKNICPSEGVAAFNPAFDVTPHRLVTAFITERGVIRPPFDSKISRILR
ncbi:MAG TPA: S-methyl-5-thioribose-1-phosphate isomerase [Candidatus Sumerlaeota bacterium]|nr:S-methyl-5-thioribose-1-phosphate isomerase [Candidatus Sumerlaeota bacterium]